MKTTKRVMCSGLAFLDKEDMQKLHDYALKGWIFKEFKGLSYILHRDEPQDLIFDYDISKVPEDEIEEYNHIFINSGWTPVKHNYKNDIHFFSAPAGTPSIHTDKKLQAESFKSIRNWSLATFLISIVITMGGISFSWLNKDSSILKTVIMMISTGLSGGSLVCFIGCYFRTKGRRLFKSNI